MKGRESHKQVWAKVNAPVDEGVLPLVEALSDFAGVCTVSSCQGYKEPGEEADASVVFAYAVRNPNRVNRVDMPASSEAARFAMWLGRELLEQVQDDAELSVSYSHNPPLLTLAVRETAVVGVADVIRGLARRPG